MRFHDCRIKRLALRVKDDDGAEALYNGFGWRKKSEQMLFQLDGKINLKTNNGKCESKKGYQAKEVKQKW